MPREIVYTAGRANRLLGWLTERLRAASALAEIVAEAQKSVGELEGLSRSNGHGDIDARIKEARDAVRRDLEGLRGIVKEITDRGIEVRDVHSGLVDFPGRRDGRKVWLCWRVGEDEVGWWHEVDTGFAGREEL